MNEKQKLLRYAELSFKRQQLSNSSEAIPEGIVKEIESIKNELGLSHEEIMACVEKNLIEDN
jgi:hypothetical protein